MKTYFTCPICSAPLAIENRTYKCPKNHCFDIAKEGYVNLLPANRKNSKSPGDTKEMIRARHDFLVKGYYHRLTEAMIKTISSTVGETILDSGCGDGYFLSSICEKLNACGIGTDISKPAIQIAAKYDRNIEWAVASSFKLPVADNSCDVVIRMFAPGDDAEVVRILKDNGLLITVTPGPDHLFGLKKMVYANPRPHEIKEIEISGMKKLNSSRVNKTMQVNDKADLKNLLTMTPYYWNGDREVKETFDSLSSLETATDFIITTYQSE